MVSGGFRGGAAIRFAATHRDGTYRFATVMLPVLVVAFLATRAVGDSALAIGVAQAIYLSVPLLAAAFVSAAAWVAPHRTRSRLAWTLLASIFVILLIGETYAAWRVTFVADEPAPLGSLFDIANAFAALLFVVLLAVSSGLDRLGIRRAARFVLGVIIIVSTVFVSAVEFLPLTSVPGADGFSSEIIRAASYSALGVLVLAGAGFLATHIRSRGSFTSTNLLILSVIAFALGTAIAPLVAGLNASESTGLFADLSSAALSLAGYYLAFLAGLKQLRTPFAPWTNINDVRLRQPTLWLNVTLETLAVGAVIWASTLLGFREPGSSTHSLVHGYFWVISGTFALLTVLTVRETDYVTQRALVDPITRCPNALALSAAVADACRIDAATGQPLTALLLLDLDDMARVNARCGFAEGDRLLHEIAAAVRALLPQGFTLFRGYGDEMVVLTRSGSPEQLEKLSLTIRGAVRAAATDEIPVTASVGIASADGGLACSEALLASASTAARWAKRQGKNASVTFHETLASEPWQIGSGVLDSDIALPEIVAALVTAIEANDQSLSGHARRVALFSRALATRLGMEHSHVQRVELAALLHDVGMMMLHDPTTGSDETAREERHRHAVVGAELVAAIGIFDIAHWIAAHHEYWNGTGGPSGAQGDRIPVEARIISLADAFDFYTSPRPHGLGYSRAAGLQQLDLEMGIRFDPTLTDEFISVIASDESLAASIGGGL